MLKYDKDKIKENLSIDQVFTLVSELGGEPRMGKDDSFFVSKTICHNTLGEGSHKLYYYDNTKLFRCYTDCGDTFDIFELVCRVKNTNNQLIKKIGSDIREWQLPDAIFFVTHFFGISVEESSFEEANQLVDWDIFKKYTEKDCDLDKTVELKIFDDTILKHLPRPRILEWEQEGISKEVCESRNIAYDPVREGIVIPHYDKEGNLIGIRERTLIKEQEIYGKYRPAILNYHMYNHPLGFNLYNLNYSKENIKRIKKAIIFEGEKSCLLYASYFGVDNDISVACCGSSLISYQVKLLLNLGVEEIVVGFDKQFQKIGDDEWKRWTKKLTDINNKYSKYIKISFLFDLHDLLQYKDSPIDQGEETFKQLFKERIYL